MSRNNPCGDLRCAKELMARASAKNAISQMSQRRIARAIQASVISNGINQERPNP